MSGTRSRSNDGQKHVFQNDFVSIRRRTCITDTDERTVFLTPPINDVSGSLTVSDFMIIRKMSFKTETGRDPGTWSQLRWEKLESSTLSYADLRDANIN